MYLYCGQSRLHGPVDIPGSKSHTIRAVTFCSLADGESTIREPLSSADTQAAVDTWRALGAEIEVEPGLWRVRGTGGEPATPGDFIDVKNSGTTLRLAVGAAALLREGYAGFTGDHQIRRRPIGPLACSLNDLGAKVFLMRNNGCPPLVVGGRLRGGRTSIEAVTSQYLSSLLICTPLADGDSVIDVPLLNEQPYVHITLDWLARMGAVLERDELRQFRVPGRQRYRATDVRVAADFSSATFFLAAGALGDNDVLVRGLDMNDPQGDKAVVEYLQRMGASVEFLPEGIRVRPGTLTGCEIDMNATPDALPMMAVVGCFARGTTRLVNVPQARLKETDRIAVMAAELGKMGARIKELPDGLIIEQSDLRPAAVSGHDDHRVVMALAVAGCCIPSGTRIDTAEAMSVTFPTFVECLTGLGGDVRLEGTARS
ncbi:MAG TPA: 3-phosphoshikimate 1-carboxyvinyltransferase [Phycisphaerae bacterium]|nr:3-phosphoshikimate 1-carboxyvinyltransferase [Phycisphaerae bacterium]HOJ72982.1 3-phosphoshikimate 1-carboxyvinyltransferase [Phycisphaerae bacterium]HOM50166.1 3-phosphoshikimate 1-carboxyvinyltransferase [Phycisphaerae bacterium]HON65274.1 3-phosphoshikimate 1-carboxyvinyltransferase [Phycisphaerae bacterium]HOQ84315.1 3-phosphoshikimate 1-carboxyvinyltransferase [Phycisphaerae bacterium]